MDLTQGGKDEEEEEDEEGEGGSCGRTGKWGAVGEKEGRVWYVGGGGRPPFALL